MLEFWVAFMVPDTGLDNPCGSLPTQANMILQF